MKWKVLLIICLLTSGCAGKEVKQPLGTPEVVTQWRTFDCGPPPGREKVFFNEVTFEIINERYTLKPEQYANLGENVSLIIKALGQMSQVIDFYEDCIKAAQNEN